LEWRGRRHPLFSPIVIDQRRKLAANIEGNQLTAQQLDLVKTMLPKKN
jgi:hypothetical protein